MNDLCLLRQGGHGACPQVAAVVVAASGGSRGDGSEGCLSGDSPTGGCSDIGGTGGLSGDCLQVPVLWAARVARAGTARRRSP